MQQVQDSITEHIPSPATMVFTRSTDTVTHVTACTVKVHALFGARKMAHT